MTDAKKPQAAKAKAPTPAPAAPEAQAPEGLTMEQRMAAMEDKLMERFDVADAREAELDAREAALAPRERDDVHVTMSRKADDSRFLNRLAIDHYAPPSQLEVPEDGEYSYRWVAEYVNGSHMPRGVNERMREGYVRVTAESLPEDFLVDEDTFNDGYARTSGLILMRIPMERKLMRDRYYANLSQERLGQANELQGIAGRDSVKEDRGSRSLTGAEAGRALHTMSTS